MIALFLLAALLVPAVPADAANGCATPIVRTESGRLCGNATTGGTPGGTARPILEYLGIPYAAPPTRERRWAAPVAPEPWEEVRDAKQFGPSCPQNLSPGVRAATSEDCLSLNVWTPNRGGSLPVLVFLYGGSFVHGGTAAPVYDGANLAGAGPVVVVTLNYRLGALGFLAGLGPFDGNYGLLDQQLALRWVRENIPGFGGDPNRVTLFGQSSGAMSVGIHLAAGSSRPLFRAAILESNPYGIPYKTREQAGAYASTLAGHLECVPQADPVSCLRAKSVEQILAAQKKVPLLEPLLLGLASFVPWGPVVGTPPLERQPNETRIDKPVILGTNRNDGALFVAMQERSIGEIGEVKYVMETDVAYGERGSAVRKFYAGPEAPTKRGKLASTPTPPTPAESLSRIVTDDLFTCANRYMLGRASVPIWGYQFVYPPSFSVWPSFPICAPETRRVCHAAELPFVFGNPFPPQLDAKQASFTKVEERLSGDMMRLWTGFATNLVPPEESPTWVAFTADDPFRLLIGDPMDSSFDLVARCRFWDALGYDRSGPLAALF